MFLTVISERHRKASRKRIKRYKERLTEKKGPNGTSRKSTNVGGREVVLA